MLKSKESRRRVSAHVQRLSKPQPLGVSLSAVGPSSRAGGPSSDSLPGRPKKEIARQAIESLSHLLGISAARIKSQIEKLWVCDWQSDPFARGAYSYVPVGALDAVKKLASSVERVLHFAGEATDYEGLGGTVDAAIKTGRRAAREILSHR